MSNSVALEEGTPQPYNMKIMSELLTQAHILGLDTEEFIGFFASQVQAMLGSSPNFNKFGIKARVWVMRGFYPETNIFFKMVLMETNKESRWNKDGGYYVKVSPLRVNFYYKGNPREDSVVFNGAKLTDNLTNRMENALLGANHKLEPLHTKKIRMPRCMSPKGIRIFNYKKPKIRSKKGS